VRYFPEPLRVDFLETIKEHRLRREIIATHVANNVVNRAGITFVSDIAEETGIPAGDITRAYLVSREAFGMRKLWKAVEALDNQVAADVQYDMILRLMELVRQATLWFVRNAPKPLDIAATVDAFAPGIAELWENLGAMQTDQARAQIGADAAKLTQAGVPDDLAQRIGGTDLVVAACHIVHAARQIGRGVTDVGATYFGLGARLGLDWLRQAARELQPKDHWERLAVTAIVEDLYDQQRALTGRVFEGANGATGDAAIDRWVDQHPIAVERTQSLIGEFKSAGGVDIARLAIANRHVRAMILE
jgi:glutamate dehydrogenase